MIASNYFLRWVLIVFIIVVSAIIILALVLGLCYHNSTPESLGYKENLGSNYQEVGSLWSQYRLYIYALLITIGVGIIAAGSIMGLLA